MNNLKSILRIALFSLVPTILTANEILPVFKNLKVLQIMNVGWDAPNGNRSLSVRPQLLAFNENYRSYAKEQNLPLLDHSIAWNKLEKDQPEVFHRLVPDGSHPIKEGCLLYTWPLVKSWLETARGN